MHTMHKSQRLSVVHSGQPSARKYACTFQENAMHVQLLMVCKAGHEVCCQRVYQSMLLYSLGGRNDGWVHVAPVKTHASSLATMFGSLSAHS